MGQNETNHFLTLTRSLFHFPFCHCERGPGVSLHRILKASGQSSPSYGHDRLLGRRKTRSAVTRSSGRPDFLTDLHMRAQECPIRNTSKKIKLTLSVNHGPWKSQVATPPWKERPTLTLSRLPGSQKKVLAFKISTTSEMTWRST